MADDSEIKKSNGPPFGYRKLERSLQRQIAQELKTVDPGKHTATELEEKAKRINQLQELAEAAHTASPLRRVEKWAVFGLLILALLAITFLVFTRVKVTNVETELKVSQVTFMLAKDSPVIQPMNVADVQIFDAKSVIASADENIDLKAPEGAVARILSANDGLKNSSKPGQISLPGLSFRKGTTLSVKAEENGRLRLAVSTPAGNDPPVELNLTGRGAVNLFLSGDTNSSASLNLDSPYVIRVMPSSREFNLDFSLLPDTTMDLLPLIPVSDTSFHEEDAESAMRQVSAVKSGYLIRTELGVEKVDLRPFEPLKMSGCDWQAKTGCLVLRRLTMSKDGITLQLYGNVTGIKTGPSGAERNLLPSLLEWVNSNHHVKLLWTSIIFASGLIFALIRWITKGG